LNSGLAPEVVAVIVMVRRLLGIAVQDHDLVLEEAVIVTGIDVGVKVVSGAVPIRRGRGALADTKLGYSWDGLQLCSCKQSIVSCITLMSTFFPLKGK
jgi:hypothetical protein